ncbi:hypothetical protein COCNU_scaffold005064G000010 [Cocos nucifera]|nr:hypothetical protein [Cocos nucifera]
MASHRKIDADAVEKLTRGLFALKKRKGKAPGESLKWARVHISDPVAPAIADIAPEVGPQVEVIPTAHTIATEGESLSFEPENLPLGFAQQNLLPTRRRRRKSR